MLRLVAGNDQRHCSRIDLLQRNHEMSGLRALKLRCFPTADDGPYLSDKLGIPRGARSVKRSSLDVLRLYSHRVDHKIGVACQDSFRYEEGQEGVEVAYFVAWKIEPCSY